MAKSFFEVFPQLKLDTDLHGMLDDATVSKVSTTRQRNSLRIYLGCGRLLPKEKIYFLESELKRQLFPHHTMNIKIIESFQLSEQYTLKKSAGCVLEQYSDRIFIDTVCWSITCCVKQK